MPVCSRCGLLGLALFVLALVGCDTNNPGRDLEIVAGTYTLTEITFDPQANALPDVDVDARLNLTTTRLEIFSDDEEALLRVAFNGEGTRRINLRVSASRGQVRLEAVEDEDVDDLADLLLPPSFTLRYAGDRPVQIENAFQRDGVNLEAFDPDRYQGLTDVSGEITIAFER